MADHDDPTTEAKESWAREARELLYECMRDPNALIEDRIDAAAYLLLMDRMPDILHQIHKFGELGLKEYFESLPPNEQAEVRRVVDGIMRCNTLGVSQLTAWTPIKGHG
jgi:hypothetical protein